MVYIETCKVNRLILRLFLIFQPPFSNSNYPLRCFNLLATHLHLLSLLQFPLNQAHILCNHPSISLCFYRQMENLHTPYRNRNTFTTNVILLHAFFRDAHFHYVEHIRLNCNKTTIVSNHIITDLMVENKISIQ